MLILKQIGFVWGGYMKEYTVKVKGKTVYYKQSGDGQCMVMLHGIPTNSDLWDGMIPYLEKYYSICAFDLLGFGRSEKLDSFQIDIKSQAEFFLEVFKELSLKNIIAVGHDIGGGIAQIMTLLSPGTFKSIILIDSVCYDSWPIQLLSAESKVEMLFRHLPRDVRHDLFIKYIRDGLYNKQKTQLVVEKYWAYLDNDEGIEAFLRTVESFDNKYTCEISHLLYNIRIPVLILWGRHDAFIRLSYAYRLNEDIRNSVIKVIEDSGHFLPEDQPDKAAKIIKDFLDNFQ